MIVYIDSKECLVLARKFPYQRTTLWRFEPDLDHS